MQNAKCKIEVNFLAVGSKIIIPIMLFVRDNRLY